MAHWRDTYKPPRFFIFDAYAGVFLFACALHVRIWTIGSALAVMLLFWWLERLGLSFRSAIRALRTWLVGDDRPARPPRMRRGRIDYDRRPMPGERSPPTRSRQLPAGAGPRSEKEPQR